MENEYYIMKWNAQPYMQLGAGVTGGMKEHIEIHGSRQNILHNKFMKKCTEWSAVVSKIEYIKCEQWTMIVSHLSSFRH